MEFWRRKREGGHDNAVDDDEEKMEQFFAIVQRYRNAFADRRLVEEEGETADGAGGGRTEKRRKVAAATSWVPKFEWEDFNTTVEFRGAVSTDLATAAAGLKGIRNKEEGKLEKVVKNEDENGNPHLKLTLSL